MYSANNYVTLVENPTPDETPDLVDTEQETQLNSPPKEIVR